MDEDGIFLVLEGTGLASIVGRPRQETPSLNPGYGV